jgi:endonuclease YncB( thermonuclease family)
MERRESQFGDSAPALHALTFDRGRPIGGRRTQNSRSMTRFVREVGREIVLIFREMGRDIVGLRIFRKMGRALERIRIYRVIAWEFSGGRIFREIIRAMASLPLLAKIAIGLIIPVIFLIVTQWERLDVVTQWERLASKLHYNPKPSAASFSSPQPQVPFNNFSTKPSEKTAIDPALAKHLASFEVIDPIVQANGTITGGGKTLYLYGIKQFDSKALCTKASGERWACGLHAFAALRNDVAGKKITCDQKTLTPNALSATCRIGANNIALRIVRDGLIELDDNADDEDLIKAQDSAKSQKLGIWNR